MKHLFRNSKERNTVEAFFKRYGYFPVRFRKKLKREKIWLVWDYQLEELYHDS